MPVALDVQDKLILLIGGGHIAAHKIASLQQYNTMLYVVALNVSDEIKAGNIRYTEKAYDIGDLKDAFLVYACTNLPDLNERVHSDCKSLGILVNVVDNPALCDFVSPAIYKFGHMSVAVSSNARNVYQSIHIRNKIKAYLNEPHKNNIP